MAEHGHEHGRERTSGDGPLWEYLDVLVYVSVVVIAATAMDWLFTEMRARRAAAHANLLNAQSSVAHAQAANAAAATVVEPAEDLQEVPAEPAPIDEPAPSSARTRRSRTEAPTEVGKE